MPVRSLLIAAFLTALLPFAAEAGNRSNQNQILEEMRQVRTGDYRYTVDHNGRRRPRHDAPPAYFGPHDRDAPDFYGEDHPPRHLRGRR